METLSKVSFSGKKGPGHAESNIRPCHEEVSCFQADEQRQATLAERREAYQNKKSMRN